MRTDPRVAVGALAVALLAAAPARAADWDAQYVSESNNEVLLESGETTTSWFKARNVGAQTWDRSFVNLGTSNPHDRASVFANATWLNTARPTHMQEASVAPGGIGTFVFTVTAPPVGGQQTFREYFAPVADGRAWMDNDTDWLDYTVRPAQPPAVQFAVPAAAPAGPPLTVAVRAVDNVRVATVQLHLAGRVLTDHAAPYTFAMPTVGLGPGHYAVTAQAVDGAGHRATVTRAIRLLAVPNGINASSRVRFRVGFGKRLREHHTVGFGHGASVRGRLTTSTGVPIAGAALQVFAKPALRGAHYQLVPVVVTTGRDGRFAYRVPAGTSRRLRFAYTAFSGKPPTAIRRVRLGTRASLTLHASRRSVAPGGVVRFSGRLRGSATPKSDLIVVLRGLQPGFGWRTFQSVRTDPRGRFHGHWRPQHARFTTFRFHAVFRQQAGYPYDTGASRAVSVTVR